MCIRTKDKFCLGDLGVEHGVVLNAYIQGIYLCLAYEKANAIERKRQRDEDAFDAGEEEEAPSPKAETKKAKKKRLLLPRRLLPRKLLPRKLLPHPSKLLLHPRSLLRHPRSLLLHQRSLLLHPRSKLLLHPRSKLLLHPRSKLLHTRSLLLHPSLRSASSWGTIPRCWRLEWWRPCWQNRGRSWG